MVLSGVFRESLYFGVKLAYFEALRAASKKDGEPSLWDDMEKEDTAKQAPKTKQKRIKERNPDAREID